MRIYSMFIGRYQPLHEGHIKLLRTVLDEGKNVLVCLRETVVDANNPYTVEERQRMFAKAFPDKIISKRMIVISIPDVAEVCHGRKVGWGIREIALDAETQKISATKIRSQQIESARD